MKRRPTYDELVARVEQLEMVLRRHQMSSHPITPAYQPAPYQPWPNRPWWEQPWVMTYASDTTSAVIQ